MHEFARTRCLIFNLRSLSILSCLCSSLLLSSRQASGAAVTSTRATTRTTTKTTPTTTTTTSPATKTESYPESDYSYAVVIDAGSTGSRARVYRWIAQPEETSGLPHIREIHDTKVVPGVSEYADNRTLLERHVSHLIRNSVIHVPQRLQSVTPIYFMATAGMRMLLEDKAFIAIQIIQEILSNKSINPFWFEYSENARILSGEEEGVFAWIAVNYLSGVFKHNDNGKAMETIGILELGGASTQIAFVPRGDILADKFPVQIGGVVYSLYVHSYLHYGQKFVDIWIKDQLCQALNCTTKSQTIQNPCMLLEDEQFSIEEDGSHSIRFVGSGDPQKCSEMLHELVYKAHEPWHCFPKPCAIGTIYQPTIQPNFKFYALGAFIHSLQSLGIMASDGVMTPSETSKAAFEFCKRPMSKIALVRPGKRNFLSTECLMGLYMPILFTKGYGFGNDTEQIHVAKEINGHPIEWPLGAVIYESERRSCKHCPTGIRTGCAVASSSLSAATRLPSLTTLHILLLTCLVRFSAIFVRNF